MSIRTLFGVSVALTLLLAPSLLCVGERKALRDLSSIRYHLISCGSSGRLGPSSDQQCITYHQNLGTTVARDNLLLLQTSPNFVGGQLVKVPRTTTYNLTVAGASGGLGLCSSVRGRGVVIRAQAELDKSFGMLVLVGQRGMGPCEFTEAPLDSPCSSLPVTNPEQCNETWWNYLLAIAGYEDGEDVYRHIGGGGGGGASMIRLESEGGLQVFPLIVAGGGGGGAAVLDFAFVDSVNFTSPINAMQEEVYQAFVDGNRESFDPLLSERRDQRGYVAPDLADQRTAGPGGGYVGEFDESRRVDGSQLIFEEAFGEGGIDCGTSFLVPITFTGEVGGFGAGGGGCGGGGGGGGQTGGAIVGAGNVAPGGGGYSFVQLSATVTGYDWNNMGDGFVEIVAADCGCVYECLVYEAEDQFQCVCPDFAELAPDLNDCYYDVSRHVQYRHLSLEPDNEILLSLIDFGSSARLYSICATLSPRLEIDGSGSGYMYLGNVLSGEDITCAIVFIGENDDLVLVSNIAQEGQNMLTKMSMIQVSFAEGIVSMSDSTDFLQSAVLVTGALLISREECFIKDMLHMNISVQGDITSGSGVDSSSTHNKLLEKIMADPELSSSLLMELLQGGKPNSTDIGNDGTDRVELSAWQIVLVGMAVAVAVVVILVVIWLCFYHRQRRKKKKVVCVELPGSIVSSLTNNAVYVSHLDSVFPQSPYCKYPTNNRSPAELSERYTTGSLPTGPESYSVKCHSGGGVLWEGGGISPSQLNFTTYNRSRSKSTFKTPEWQYPRNQLIYMRELGEGQFGKVLLMKAQRGIAGVGEDLPVAVKTLASRDPEKVAKFMEEAELMKRFSHPNIVSLLGISTNDVLDDDNAPLIILEYMVYGDLHAFLQNNKPESQTVRMSLGDAHFVSFATDVAKALEFIAQERYVHRDIAARNCLVGSGLRIKISDFGLAHELNSENYCSVEEGCVLPIRTMAPEVFLTGQFTTTSDVWSYGVLLWEMVSYGAVPLPGLSSRDIADCAQMRTLHHIIPADCPPLLSSLISQCHNHYPNLRPSFTDILALLTQTTAGLGSTSHSVC